jgi:hypothetical protein
MSSTVLKQIAALGRASTPDLQERWRQLMGAEPPHYNRDFMVKRLAHRLQELAYGGLSEQARAQMNQLLDDAGYNELGSLRAGSRPKARADLPVAGTRLVREWDGQRHEVTVVHGGFEYRGKRYRSLSAIASTITGTHWNGRRFFGLPTPDNGRRGR